LLDADLKIIFFETLKTMSNIAKNVDIPTTSLSVPYNYFDSSTEFSDLYPAKIFDLSAKPFFPCTQLLMFLIDFR